MKKFVVFLFIFTFVFSLFSDSKNLPYWILLEKGRQLLSRNEEIGKSNMTEAINYLQEALLRKGIYPESSYYLSIAYKILGNMTLEKLNLQKALEDRDYLVDKSFEKNILYSLAKISEFENNYVEMVDYLNDILEKFSNQKDYYNYYETRNKSKSAQDNVIDISFYIDSYLKQIRGTSGLDFTFTLYRFNNYNLIDAHSEISRIYLNSGAYGLAITHGLVASVGILTRINEYIKYYEPTYEFKNLRLFFEKINEYSDIKKSFESTNFWEIVYNIANATYMYGDSRNHQLRAMDSWMLIIDFAPKSSPVFFKARSQIKNPIVLKSVYF